MNLDPRAWRRFDAKAWAETQCAPATPRRRGQLRKRHGATLAQMGAAWAIFALGATSIALAQGGGGGGDPSANAAAGEGDPIDLARRNPRSGAANRETAVVTNRGNGGLVIRPSNTASGGRAISATCDNDGLAAEDGCAVYVNKGQGAAASFRTQGSVPFAIRDTNNGRVANLNADLLDNFHAGQLISAARTKAGLAAETADTADRADSAAKVDDLLTTGSYVRQTATDGASFEAARTAAPEVSLFQSSGFEVYGKCFRDTSGPTVHAKVYIRPAQDGSILGSDDTDLDGDPAYLDTDTAEEARDVTSISAANNTAAIETSDNDIVEAAGPGGQSLSGIGPAVAAKQGTPAAGNGVYGEGNVCLFWGFGVI